MLCSTTASGESCAAMAASSSLSDFDLHCNPQGVGLPSSDESIGVPQQFGIYDVTKECVHNAG